MRRTATEYIRHLEMRVARLERQSSVQKQLTFVKAVQIARKVKIRREGDINLALIVALQRGGAPQSDSIKLMEDIGMSWEELNLFYGGKVSKAVHDIVHHFNAGNVAMLAVNAILKSIPEGSVPKENAIKRLNRLNIGDGTAEYESFIGE